MKLIPYLLAGLLYAGCSSTRQPISAAVHYLISKPNITIFDADPLGHLYIVDGTDRLSKYDTTGLLISHVVNKNLGEVHSVDAGNPFKTMVFYRDQQTIILYDRTLSEIQRIRLSDWGYHDITAACLSPDNAIWIFDGTSRTLLKLDASGNSIITSDPFDILQPASKRPDFIYDMDHHLLLKENHQTISVFDDFGKFLYNTDIDPEKQFSVSSPFVITQSGNTVQMFNIPERKYTSPLFLKANMAYDRIFFFGKHFYTFDARGVYGVEGKIQWQ